MQNFDSLDRLKALFRELFQLDTADLDFGLYRLFRLKRAEIEAFLGEQLPAEVDKAFASVTDAERETLKKQVEDLARQATESVADDAILPTGQPNPEHAGTKAVKEYAEACQRLESAEVSEAQRAEAFNQLYAFFSRYYEDGDFIPRRFFGAHAAYAVPYNGEEVFFHWANKDQYYVKSGEAFRDYAFTVSTLHGEYRVRFKLDEATTPRDNAKGDTRFFFPRPKDAAFDEATKTFTIPFEYRLPSESEATRYGAKNKAQEAILDEAAPKVLKAVTDPVLGAELEAHSPTGREAEGETPPSLLRRRLSHFTKKNTTDYFVHKNLGAFLRQELEFFIRDQIVHEADLEGDFEAKRRMLQVFRKLADTVITFLSQIEDAQKRLFEKKKFVLRTDYLVPVQNIPPELWPKVLANKAQIAEWKALYALNPKSDLFNVKGKINKQVLKENPTLVVDTRHFASDPSPGSGQSFIARLLEAIEDIDEWTDGVLIHGENFQGLNLMRERYREQVKCVYIDPPYNTGKDFFLYKDGYQSGSWLAMMRDRLSPCVYLLRQDSAFFSSIDGKEFRQLSWLLDETFGGSNAVGTVVWRNARDNNPTRIAIEHEYVQCYVRNLGAADPIWKNDFADAKEILLEEYERLKEQRLPLEEIQTRLREFIKDNASLLAEIDRYKFVDDNGVYTGSQSVHNPHPGGYEYEVLHPITKRPMRMPANGYRFPEATMRRDFIEKDRLIYGPDENRIVQIKLYLRDYKDSFRSVVDLDGRLGAYALQSQFGRNGNLFENPKPPQLLRRLLSFASTPDAIVLDYFAGSGTTAQSILEIIRATGERMRFILVEMADYFDTVLVPRIKKVMFTPEWKAGKPKRFATKEEAERTPRLVKVLRLESYEDALHNTFSDTAVGKTSKREKAVKEVVGHEAYRIRYLVKLPLEASDAMLSLAGLEHPFDYTLEVLTDLGPKTRTVDLVETFNWLYGLRVKRLFTWINKKDKTGKDKGGRRYQAVSGTDREGKKRVLVVWRDMTGLDPATDRKFLETKAKKIGPFEEQWVNGDSAAKGFASLDALFKRLMAGDEV